MLGKKKSELIKKRKRKKERDLEKSKKRMKNQWRKTLGKTWAKLFRDFLSFSLFVQWLCVEDERGKVSVWGKLAKDLCFLVWLFPENLARFTGSRPNQDTSWLVMSGLYPVFLFLSVVWLTAMCYFTVCLPRKWEKERKWNTVVRLFMNYGYQTEYNLISFRVCI